MEERDLRNDHLVLVDKTEQQPFDKAEEELPDELWVTVAEYQQVNRHLMSRKTVYRHVARGLIKYRKHRGQCYIYVTNPEHIYNVLQWRKTSCTHTIEVMAPNSIVSRVEQALGAANASDILDQALRNISMTRKTITVSHKTYERLHNGAANRRLTVPELITHIIYDIIREA